MPGIEGRNVFATKKGDVPREFAESSAQHLYPEYTMMEEKKLNGPQRSCVFFVKELQILLKC